MGFKVKLPENALGHPEQVKAFMAENILPFVQRSADYLQAEVERLTPEGVTGNLRGSYSTEIRGDDSTVGFRGVVVSSSPYVDFVDQGQRPHWVPIEALRAWADLKGLNVYQVRWGIAQRGVEGQYIFQRAERNTKATIQADWSRTIGAVWYKLKRIG